MKRPPEMTERLPGMDPGKIYREYPDGVRSFQITGMRCQECDHPFTAEMEVDVPVDRWVSSMKSITCPECGSGKLYMGMGLSLSEDRTRRRAGGTVEERLGDWLHNGERGLSSEYVAHHMSGVETRPSHPHDYDDLRRVILLIDRIPEWAPRMKELSGVPGWEKIAARWDDIVTAVITADPEAKNPVGANDVLTGIYR